MGSTSSSLHWVLSPIYWSIRYWLSTLPSPPTSRTIFPYGHASRPVPILLTQKWHRTLWACSSVEWTRCIATVRRYKKGTRAGKRKYAANWCSLSSKTIPANAAHNSMPTNWASPCNTSAPPWGRWPAEMYWTSSPTSSS